jgi:Flp pilus assembly protein TadG
MRALQRALFKGYDEGSVAVEFGLTLPLLIMLSVGTLYIGIVMYSLSGLHNAVEAAARCYSVDAAQCGTATATQAHATAHYYGSGSPTFVAAATSCGHQVSATGERCAQRRIEKLEHSSHGERVLPLIAIRT